MSDRININDEELEQIVGGSLRFSAGMAWPADNPQAVYRYTNYYDCLRYIKAHWGSAPMDEGTLIMLVDAGLMSKAY